MNKLISLIHIFFFILMLFKPVYAGAPTDISLAPMLKSVLPAIVNVKAQIKVDLNTLRELQRRNKNKDNDDDRLPQAPISDTIVSVASGVIVDANRGYILTNAHVIDDAKIVIVTLDDGRHFTAKIIGTDKPSDVALLQIKAKNLTAIPIANSSDLKVGDFVAAIGNPFGLNQTVTSGIVSGLGRTTLGIENYENFIQTDAPINLGNSGGALVSMQGQLVGINTAILAPDRGSIGIGFAIPTNMAKRVMEQLIEYGNVKRGVLGIGAQDITPELAVAFNMKTAKGAAVTQVVSDSPAAQAGIQIGDIITSVNNNETNNASDVVNTVGFLRVGTKTNIEILRQGKSMTISVVLSDPKLRKQLVERNDPFLFGVGLKNFSVLSPIHGKVKGILVVSIEQESNAGRADLRAGDIITSANQHKVQNIDELKAIATKSDQSLLLNIIRGPGAIFLVVNKEEA
ncbi:MAG TPA: Do family serine endopeptidase [Gammaproteobacteria bacterium]|nr:Do family serine endopeptidase [Gammaproteobacteria bacterium]